MSDFSRPLGGVRAVETLRDDTLQAIAARELGDAARWADLAAINDLIPPYLTTNPAEVGPKVRLAGAIIMVPSGGLQDVASVQDDDIYQIDAALDAGGNLGLTDGDLTLAAGQANLRQALTHRIDTEVGELLFHQNYGCKVRQLLGAVTGPTRNLLAAQYARAALEADPRVVSVPSATATASGDVTSVLATVEPVTGGNVKFEAEV